MSPGKILERLRHGVDNLMIFASLMVLAWPMVFERLTDDGARMVDWLLPIVVVLFLGFAVARLTQRWPLAQYAPASAAVVMAAILHATGSPDGVGLTWLIIVVAGTILLRQFLGSHTNEGLMRDLTRQRAILARQAYRDPLTGLGNRRCSWTTPTTRSPTPTAR